MKALSIWQPHAEAIMRGVKPIGFQSRPSNVRARIYIYASLARPTRALTKPRPHPQALPTFRAFEPDGACCDRGPTPNRSAS